MIDVNAIIVGAVGLVTTITSGWVSWLFARKKYNSEVDHNLIQNMESSLEFYKKLSDDTNARVTALTTRNRELEVELQELRKQVLTLTMNICMDLTCMQRVRERSILANRKKNAKDSNRFDETENPDRG